MTKEYLFWREVRKTVREECVIEADSLEEATKRHNEEADYEETKEEFWEINDEGTEEVK